MKPTLLITVLFFFFQSSFSQSSKTAYLVIKIERMVGYYRIIADTGSAYAQDVYQLIEHKNQKKGIAAGAVYYSDRTDSSKVFYNYFSNITEALQFLADRSWQLALVNNEMFSDSFAPDARPFPRPVYYLKKEIN